MMGVKLSLMVAWLAHTSSAQIAGSSVEINITSNGLARTFSLYAPTGWSAGGAAIPLVLNFHGLTNTVSGFMNNARTEDDANRHRFAVAYPAGVGRSFNAGIGCCPPASLQGVDDVQFARDIVAEVNSRMNVRLDAVFSMGYSNGGFMSHRLACEAPDLIRAIAPNAGRAQGCNPGGPVPVISIQGDADTTVSITGITDYERDLNTRLDQNNCNANNVQNLQVTSTSSCRLFTECDDGAFVEWCLVAGGGHIWFRGPQDIDTSAYAFMRFAQILDGTAPGASGTTQPTTTQATTTRTTQPAPTTQATTTTVTTTQPTTTTTQPAATTTTAAQTTTTATQATTTATQTTTPVTSATITRPSAPDGGQTTITTTGSFGGAFPTRPSTTTANPGSDSTGSTNRDAANQAVTGGDGSGNGASPMVGVVVALVVILVLLAVGVLVYFCWYRKRQKQREILDFTETGSIGSFPTVGGGNVYGASGGNMYSDRNMYDAGNVYGGSNSNVPPPPSHPPSDFEGDRGYSSRAQAVHTVRRETEMSNLPNIQLRPGQMLDETQRFV